MFIVEFNANQLARQREEGVKKFAPWFIRITVALPCGRTTNSNNNAQVKTKMKILSRASIPVRVYIDVVWAAKSFVWFSIFFFSLFFLENFFPYQERDKFSNGLFTFTV